MPNNKNTNNRNGKANIETIKMVFDPELAGLSQNFFLVPTSVTTCNPSQHDKVLSLINSPRATQVSLLYLFDNKIVGVKISKQNRLHRVKTEIVNIIFYFYNDTIKGNEY